MTIRITRAIAVMAALLLSLLAIASSTTAQEATPGAITSPVTVGQTELGWTGDWQLDESSSMENQATLTQVDPDTQSIKLISFAELQDDTIDDSSAALDAFATVFLESSGATTVLEAGSGELENGAVWKLYSFDLQGLQLTTLITVSEGSAGTWVISTLTGNTDQFPATVEQAQQEITLNGEPIFLDGVDAQQVASGLNATPVATPGA